MFEVLHGEFPLSDVIIAGRGRPKESLAAEDTETAISEVSVRNVVENRFERREWSLWVIINGWTTSGDDEKRGFAFDNATEVFSVWSFWTKCKAHCKDTFEPRVECSWVCEEPHWADNDQVRAPSDEILVFTNEGDEIVVLSTFLEIAKTIRVLNFDEIAGRCSSVEAALNEVDNFDLVALFEENFFSGFCDFMGRARAARIAVGDDNQNLHGSELSKPFKRICDRFLRNGGWKWLG